MTARRAVDRPSTSLPPGLELVAARPLVRTAPLVWFPLAPGDRPLVTVGQSVLAGATLAQRVRSAVIVDIPESAVDPAATPGSWWADDGRRRGLGRTRPGAEGELLCRTDAGWRLVTGERPEPLEAPTPGIVREVRAGVGIALAVAGAGLPGVLAIGGPSRGRLELLADAEGELRAGSLDVGRAGAIVVAGSRINAEILTRARAMGIRGVVVAAVSSRDLRDIAASEARQRASLQPLPPFAILVLEGHLRRPIAGPVMAIFSALAGCDVAIVDDPPLLLFEVPKAPLPEPAATLVRIRNGPAAGREGGWLGLAGGRRFSAGVHLGAGLVEVGEGRPLAVSLWDLERFS